jgi:hypothetical protein
MPIQVSGEINANVQVLPTPESGTKPWTERAVGQDFTALLILTVFVVVVMAEVRLARVKAWSANAVRIIGLTTIAFVGVFAALTVDNEKNGPAVFGLLGTIAGYLLGRSDRHEREGRAEDETQAKSEESGPS